MPWKGISDPYKIWLSEIILQQTRVDQGINYYYTFIENFPDVYALADARPERVFKLWEGLGYYNRCRNLMATASDIARNKGGVFPDTYEDILKLKGVGPYTAAAIASFAFGLPHAVVDGNVVRVLARVFGIGLAFSETSGKKKFHDLAHKLLDVERPGIHNQAMMDFGATICKPALPLCDNCIFKKSCIAFTTGQVADFPVKVKKPKLRKRVFYFWILEYGGKIAIRERKENDIWKNLFEFPMIEKDTESLMTEASMIEDGINRGYIRDLKDIGNISAPYTQTLTHQRINAVFITARFSRSRTKESFRWVKSEELHQVAFPKIVKDYLKSRESIFL
jgi:A/G-specific adenine glycosylase